MNKNQIGLHVLFALLGLGISLLLLGFGTHFILQMYRYDTYYHGADLFATTALCVVGIICLICSIALMLRLNWARIAFQLLFILGGITWLISTVFLTADSPQTWPVLIGMSGAGIMISLFGVLLLEHPHFKKDLRNAQPDREDQGDILDQ